MGAGMKICRYCSFGFTLLVVLLALAIHDMLLPTPAIPTLQDGWWGADSSSEENTSIRPFRLVVAEEMLRDLHQRINMDLERLPPPLPDVGFRYGVNSLYMQKLARHWRDAYDWRLWERKFNSIPQFHTNISGIELHYMHLMPQKVSPSQQVVPLLLVHGWPGSLVEFLEYIPVLAAGNERVVVEVVAPHIPGYGFSSAPARTGFSALEAAQVFRKLMLRLGHKRFYTQGGDWGSVITTALATAYPENLLGLHLNMPISTTPGTMLKNILVQLPFLKYLLVDAQDLYKVTGIQQYITMLQETGYFHIQATKPDTVGLALSSSPVGLAAYMLEKFSTWTKPEWQNLEDGGLANHTIALDAMLTDVMIYWISNCITSSQRFYKESMLSESLQVLGQIPVHRATGIADTPHELFLFPRSALTGKFPNIVHYTRFKKGGHFLAMEYPTEMAADVLNFITKVEDLKAQGEEL